MLTTLRIRNLVTIEDLAVDFGPGLCVLTGETGAGKSILVDALSLLAGERADSALVRSGAERAIVEAAFSIPREGEVARALAERGLDAADGDLVLRREVASGGAGRVLVNGSPATVAALREIGGLLLELHGQHDQRGLVDSEGHLDLLDAFGGHFEALLAVEAACANLRAAEDRRGRLEALAREGGRRAERLRAVVAEIRDVAPQLGEAERLRRDRTLLQNASRVAEILDEALGRLDEGESPAIAAVHAAWRRVDELSRLDPGIEPLAGRLAAARIELQDARDTLVAYRDAAAFDPNRLEAIEARRAAIDRLLLRFGPGEEDALRAAGEAEAELATIDHLDAETAAADTVVSEARAAYARQAKVLTQARGAAASRLGPAVEAELGPLALQKAAFSVALSPARGGIGRGDDDPPVTPKGADRAEFLLAANPGEAARPLARAASGGEMSRLMLALHVVLDRGAQRPTLVFDEVDAGVSGATAQAVGARLALLAEGRQVLCVTHLPQVAAWATGHYHVGKRVSAGRTHTEIARLDGEARVAEVARMLGGKQAGKAARENAAELLGEAARSARSRGRR
jgi:DNA repair protein RecN (Recombination protein N)